MNYISSFLLELVFYLLIVFHKYTNNKHNSIRAETVFPCKWARYPNEYETRINCYKPYCTTKKKHSYWLQYVNAIDSSN